MSCNLSSTTLLGCAVFAHGQLGVVGRESGRCCCGMPADPHPHLREGWASYAVCLPQCYRHERPKPATKSADFLAGFWQTATRP